jgi:outer membrane biosynthesis protein TonB
MSDQVVTASAKAKNFFDSFSDRFQDWIPKNLNIWIISLTCLIVIVALSRLLSLQKAVSELQSRPSVDEYLVRQVVRQHLEETVKAMDQQNRIQLQMRQQQMMEQAQKAHKAMIEKQQQAAAAQQQASQPVIEVIEDSNKKVDDPKAIEPKKEEIQEEPKNEPKNEQKNEPVPVAKEEVIPVPETEEEEGSVKQEEHATTKKKASRNKGKPLGL